MTIKNVTLRRPPTKLSTTLNLRPPKEETPLLNGDVVKEYLFSNNPCETTSKILRQTPITNE